MDVMLVADVSVSESLQTALDRIFDFLPKLIAGLVILLIGYFISRLIKWIVVKALRAVRLDDRVRESGSQYAQNVAASPTAVIGSLIYWISMIGVISLSLAALEIQEVTDVVAAIYNYLPNVLAAIIIFIVAVLVAGLCGRLIRQGMGTTPMARILATITPVVIMSIAGFMILVQLKIAPTIVLVTYSSILGALALGMALFFGISFGLGGKGVAQRMLEEQYEQRGNPRSGSQKPSTGGAEPPPST